MAYDPKEPRDKSGKWAGGASGHNAGGGNRSIFQVIKNQHIEASSKMPEYGKNSVVSLKDKILVPDDVTAYGHFSEERAIQKHQFVDGPKGTYKIITHDPREFTPKHTLNIIKDISTGKSRTTVRTEQKDTLHTVSKDGKHLGSYYSIESARRAIKKGTLY